MWGWQEKLCPEHSTTEEDGEADDSETAGGVSRTQSFRCLGCRRTRTLKIPSVLTLARNART